MNRLVRGRIEDGRWVDEETLWRAELEDYTARSDMAAGGRGRSSPTVQAGRAFARALRIGLAACSPQRRDRHGEQLLTKRDDPVMVVQDHAEREAIP